MKFDDILREVGEFGPYQKRLYLLLCIPAISVGCFMMMNIILLYTPKHRCKLPDYPNDTWAVQSDWHQDLINMQIPVSNSKDYPYDRCHLYTTDHVHYNNHSRPINATTFECTEWVYDREVFKETFSSQQNFVCKDSLRTSYAQMVFYFGVLVGDLGFGLLSDIIGRKKCFQTAAVLQVAAALGVAWSPNFWVYTLLEFAVGAACHGCFMSCCVLGLELVGPSKRVWAGIIIHGFFTVGLIYLSGMAWLLQDWFYIQIAVGAPCAIYLFYWWLIEESPRWLLTMNRSAEAEKVMQKLAKVNKVELPQKMFGTDTMANKKKGGGKLWQLFTSKVLFFRTMIIFFNWIIVSMCYYGVTMYSGTIGGNFYLNFFLLAVVEFPRLYQHLLARLIIVSMCYYGVTMYSGTIGGNFYLNFFLLAVVEFPAFINIYMLDCMGRKWTHICFMWLGGFACIGTIFTVVYGGDDWHGVTLALALIGKLGPSGAFGVIYVFSLELYPTLLRNGGMGASSCVARFGGMAAPYVAEMGELIGGDFGKALPLAIFGITSVVAGMLCLFLPETLNQKLPDTVEEAKHFKGHKKGQDNSKEIVVNIP